MLVGMPIKLAGLAGACGKDWLMPFPSRSVNCGGLLLACWFMTHHRRLGIVLTYQAELRARTPTPGRTVDEFLHHFVD